MPNGNLWSASEDDFILRHVASGLTNKQIHTAFVEHFGETRSPSAVARRRYLLGDEDLPDADEEVRQKQVDEDTIEVTVVSAGKIQTVADLRESAEVDMAVWEEVKADVRNRYTPMKVNDAPLVIECRYIKLEYRRRAVSRFDLAPAIIKISRPRAKTTKQSSGDVSVHFGDKHIPHDDPRNTSILHQIIEISQPTVIIDHGDTLDAEQLGRFPKDPYNRVSLGDEVRRGCEHFGEISSLVPESCRKVWMEGNHEERKRRIVWELADKRAYGELITLPSVMEALKWDSLLGLKSLGWEDYPYVAEGDKPNHIVLYDKLICKHGSASSGNVAEKEYKKYGKSGLSGHLHRMQVHSLRDWNGQHAWHVMGMLGKIRDSYGDHQNWQNGLVVVQWSPRKDRFAFEPVHIIEGECFFRGLHLKG